MCGRALETLFPHHLSHYIGLDVHDTPGQSRKNPLKAGNCVTVEPYVVLLLASPHHLPPKMLIKRISPNQRSLHPRHRSMARPFPGHEHPDRRQHLRARRASARVDNRGCKRGAFPASFLFFFWRFNDYIWCGFSWLQFRVLINGSLGRARLRISRL